MTTKQAKRKYVKPAFKTVWLQQRTMLLAGSGTKGSRNPYGNPTEWNWE